MSNKRLRDAVRHISQWSHKDTQFWYYHTDYVEFRAIVTKGSWGTGQPQKHSWRVVATLIGQPEVRDVYSRRQIATIARRIRTGDYTWELK